MEVDFHIEASGEMTQKLGSLKEQLQEAAAFFSDKLYGDKLKALSVLVYCIHDKFANTFPLQPPRYYPKPAHAMYRGERIEKPAGTFEYECRLHFNEYKELDDIRQRLAMDIIESLQVPIRSVKIHYPGIDQLKEDFMIFFKELGWLE